METIETARRVRASAALEVAMSARRRDVGKVSQGVKVLMPHRNAGGRSNFGEILDWFGRQFGNRLDVNRRRFNDGLRPGNDRRRNGRRIGPAAHPSHELAHVIVNALIIVLLARSQRSRFRICNCRRR